MKTAARVSEQLRGVTTVTIHVYPRQNLDAQGAGSVWSRRNAAEDEHKVSSGLWPRAEPSEQLRQNFCRSCKQV